jgi:hypothetical protein
MAAPSSSFGGHGDGPLVAFVHIPKTAGGTATNMLAGAYSRAAMHDAGNFINAPDRTVKKVTRPPGGWERWQRRGGRVTAGHLPYGVFREHLPADTRYITILREPVDRVLSHFHAHFRLTGTPADQRRLERGRVLVASVEDALGLRLAALTNLATRFLCGDPSPMGKLPARALDDAKANLREFAFVGIQERFEESVVLLQRTLSLGPVPYVNRHVSMGRPAVDAISEEQRALIADHNRLDMELYSFAQGLFEDAVAAANDGFAADVEQLRALSADADQVAMQGASDFLDRELRPGTARPKAELFASAAAAGVSAAAIKRLSILLSVQKEPDHNGQVIWTRTDGPD